MRRLVGGRALLAVLATVGAAVLGCAPGPTPTPTVPAPTATATAAATATRIPTETPGPSPTFPPPPPGVKPAAAPPTPPPVLSAAQTQVAGSLGGAELNNVDNMMRQAARTGDEAQRYKAYLGAWQYLMIQYFRQGQKPEYKVALDAIEAVGKSFPQYQPDDFKLAPP